LQGQIDAHGHGFRRFQTGSASFDPRIYEALEKIYQQVKADEKHCENQSGALQDWQVAAKDRGVQ
jgi:hypothetical protein